MSRPRPNAHLLVKIFVALHLVAIVSWSLPLAPHPVRIGTVPPFGSDYLLLANERAVKPFPPLRAYLLGTGFWQYWDMFAPDPASRDVWGDAEVVRENGSVERFAYPRMFATPIPQKYVLERYRKFFERAGDSNFRYLWPQFAYRIAMKADVDPYNRPVEVRLYRHWQDIPKVGEPMPSEYRTGHYWTESIDLRLLDEAKRR